MSKYKICSKLKSENRGLGTEGNKLFNSFKTIYAALQPRRRKQLYLLVALMFIGGLAEVLSLGTIIPFLAMLADPVEALKLPLIHNLIVRTGETSTQSLRLGLTVIFVLSAAAAGIVRLVIVYAISKLNFGMGHEISAELYRRALYQPYSVHISRNSSEIVGGLAKVGIVISVIFSLLNALSSGIMAFFIVVALIFASSSVAIIIMACVGLVYIIMSLLSRSHLAKNSVVGAEMANSKMQAVQEGLGGYRDILLSHCQNAFISRFNKFDSALCQAQASNAIIGPSPRFAVEAVGMISFGWIGYYMTNKSGGFGLAIPILGTVAVGAQRLMPLVQQIYIGWVMVVGNKLILEDVSKLLCQPVEDGPPSDCSALRFERSIEFKHVSFRYQDKLPIVVNQISLMIPRGSRLGIFGSTGSGKSTIVDLLMGLLEPSSGIIFVDNVPLSKSSLKIWQNNIAHVPQVICLSDGTFSENIAFGVPTEEIDISRVEEAARKAQIDNYIKSTPLGFLTIIGERGIQLSGGQRQRLAIARALYKKAKILVFDEATSALDSATESTVMETIDNIGENITTIVIAHRISTLERCHQIIEIDQGAIKRRGTYGDLFGR